MRILGKKAVIENWPGANGVIMESFRSIKPNFWNMLFVFLIFNIFDYALSSLFMKNQYYQYAVLIVMWVAFNVLIYYYALANLNKRRVLLINAFKDGAKFYLKALGLFIILLILSFISFVAFIVPFFVIMPRLFLSTYLILDKNLSIVDALSTSWKLTEGKYSKIYAYYGLYALYIIAAFLCLATVVLLPVFIYLILVLMNSTALAYSLLYVTHKKSKTTKKLTSKKRKK